MAKYKGDGSTISSGSNSVTVDATGVRVVGELSIPATTVAADCPLQFTGDPNTGLRYISSDSFALESGGVDKITVGSAFGTIIAFPIFGTFCIIDNTASLSGPSLQVNGDPNTGMGRIGGADTFGRVAGGVETDRGVADAATADTETNILVRRNVGGSFSLARVSMGAADSGGAGFKLLRVPN